MYSTAQVRPVTRRFSRCALLVVCFSGICGESTAATIRVPEDHETIQAAIDSARAGDTVLVSPGTYAERIRLKPEITVRSSGDSTDGKLGLARAEATIIDGSGKTADRPGVEMASGATLDGFTVTGVGRYDDALWRRHHATQGEEQSHERIGTPGTPGIRIDGVTCTVRNNIVHHIGSTGIAILGVENTRCSPHVIRNVAYRNMGGGIGSMRGSTAIIEQNICFQNFYAGIGHHSASPLVIENVCYENIRAGIGVSEGSSPVLRGNRCYKNRRAGIGIRAGSDTAPLVERNECYENDMAGIGSRDDATPIIRNNRCYKNAMAGIGCRTGARPLIVENECFQNGMAGIGTEKEAAAVIVNNRCYENARAGIGVREKASATILDNECTDNKLVAIGVRNGSTAHIARNELTREGGMPPMIAVLEGSSAVVADNVVRGGGVAGVLVEGTARISGNRFEGNGPRRGGPPNFAAWVRAGSVVSFRENRVDRWRHALSASGASRVVVADNTVSRFLGAAIVVDGSESPAHVFGNVAISQSDDHEAASVNGPRGIVADNERRPPGPKDAR